jgi:hypothetical protein
MITCRKPTRKEEQKSTRREVQTIYRKITSREEHRKYTRNIYRKIIRREAQTICRKLTRKEEQKSTILDGRLCERGRTFRRRS